MSDSIQQSFGLDASQALEALNQLDSAFSRFAATIKDSAASFKSFNASAAKTVSALGGLGSSSASTASKVTASNSRVGSSFQQTSAQSVAAIDRMTVSLALINRVIATQLVVRALNQLRRSFQDTAEEAVNFQRQIARSLTITTSGENISQLSDSVLRLSNTLNLPLLSVAAGQYRTFSNQIEGTAREIENFQVEAGRFAKSTGSTLAEAIDLGSAAIKSFGLSTNDADKVFSNFFKTLELGRGTASGLANSFGQIGPVAAALGLSLEEALAAQAAISIQGTNTAQSLTAVRGIMTALLKPSDDLDKVFKEMGFSSAEATIATLGFANTLRALNDRVGGSVSGLSTLFRNVRGLTGVASLTGDDLVTLADDIDKMKSSARSLNSSKALDVMATDAEKVTSEFNKLHNALVTGLGQDLLRGSAALFEFAGGAESVANGLERATPAIGGLAASLVLLQGRFIAARNNATLLTGALGSLSLFAATFAGASFITDLLGEKLLEKSAPLKKLEEDNSAALQGFKSQLNEAKDAAIEADRAMLQSALSLTQGLNKEYLKEQAGLKDLKKARQDAAKEVEASERRVSDAIATLEDQRFDSQNKRFNSVTQALRSQQRAQELASKAASQLSRANTDAEREAALAVFQRANAYAKLATSTADQTKNTTLQAQAENTLESVLQKRIDAERAFQSHKAQQAKAPTPRNFLAGVQGVDQLSALTKSTIKTPDDLTKGLITAEKRAEELHGKLADALNVQEEANRLKTEITTIFDQINAKSNVRASVGSANAPALNQQFENLLTLFKEVQKDGKVTEGELKVLADAGKQFSQNAFGGGFFSADRVNQTLGFASSVKQLGDALEKMQALSKLPEVDVAGIRSELQSIEGFLSGFSQANRELQQGASASKQIADNLGRAATNSAQIKIPGGQSQAEAQAQALGGLIKGYSEGGYVHLAAGGFAKGTDTVPAMLTKGEMVINAQSTRRFLPQLQAINAGIQPAFRGGDTFNQTVGDIVINADPNPRVTAREVAEAIRREQRRGTVRQ